MRTELLVIITPRVVRTDVDIREVSEDLRESLKGLREISGSGDGRKLTPTPISTPSPSVSTFSPQ